mgnify:CR=1 FL=1
MRIITGDLRGREIAFNPRRHGDIRVTSSRLKESLFGMLGPDLNGQTFLDLCAGCGQIGLEAYSRGAQVMMNEPDRRRNQFIAKLLRDWNLENHIQLHARPAQKLIPHLESKSLPFDIIYLDPPYNESLGETPMALAFLTHLSTTSLLTPTGTLVVQHTSHTSLPKTLHNLSLSKQKKYGETTVTAYQAVNA